ncbi:hypothetical protein KI387_030908, partial [Taxus chinensis]
IGDGGDKIGLEDSIVLGLGDEVGKIGLGVDEEDEHGVGAKLDGLELGVEGDEGDLGVKMYEIVLKGLGLGDRGDEIGLQDKLNGGLADVGLSRRKY